MKKNQKSVADLMATKKIITNFMLWSLVFYQKKTPISRLVFVVSIFLCHFDEGEIT